MSSQCKHVWQKKGWLSDKWARTRNRRACSLSGKVNCCSRHRKLPGIEGSFHFRPGPQRSPVLAETGLNTEELCQGGDSFVVLRGRENRRKNNNSTVMTKRNSSEIWLTETNKQTNRKKKKNDKHRSRDHEDDHHNHQQQQHRRRLRSGDRRKFVKSYTGGSDENTLEKGWIKRKRVAEGIWRTGRTEIRK